MQSMAHAVNCPPGVQQPGRKLALSAIGSDALLILHLLVAVTVPACLSVGV